MNEYLIFIDENGYRVKPPFNSLLMDDNGYVSLFKWNLGRILKERFINENTPLKHICAMSWGESLQHEELGRLFCWAYENGYTFYFI